MYNPAPPTRYLPPAWDSKAYYAWEAMAMLLNASLMANSATDGPRALSNAANDACNGAHSLYGPIAAALGFEIEVSQASERCESDWTGERLLTECLELAWDSFGEALELAMARTADSELVAAIGRSVPSTVPTLNTMTGELYDRDIWRDAVYIHYALGALDPNNRAQLQYEADSMGVTVDEVNSYPAAEVRMLASLAPLAAAAFNAAWMQR